MKLLLGVAVLLGAYMYMLTHTTDIVLGQLNSVQAAYQQITSTSESIAAEAR